MSDCCSGPHPHRKPIRIEMTAADFFENYSELESLLREYSPDLIGAAGSGLDGSLAGLTTLGQLAETRGESGTELVRTLKSAAAAKLGVDYNSSGEGKPDWFTEDKIAGVLDAREILAAGGHPMGQVLESMPGLKTGEIFELQTPFLPGPLINRMAERGFLGWSSCDENDLFHNYFLKG